MIQFFVFSDFNLHPQPINFKPRLITSTKAPNHKYHQISTKQFISCWILQQNNQFHKKFTTQWPSTAHFSLATGAPPSQFPSTRQAPRVVCLKCRYFRQVQCRTWSGPKKHLKQDQIALIHTDSWIAARGSYHYTATVQGSFYSPLSGPICSNHRSTKRHLERIPSPHRALSCTTKKNLQIWLAPTEIHKASNRLYVFFHIGMHVHINYIEIYICTDP